MYSLYAYFLLHFICVRNKQFRFVGGHAEDHIFQRDTFDSGPGIFYEAGRLRPYQNKERKESAICECSIINRRSK
jgi:hypothetical protein